MPHYYSMSFKEQKAFSKILKRAFRIRNASVTQRDALISRLIEAAKALSTRKLKKLNYEKGTSIAYITAYRQDKSKKENKKRNSEMIRKLQQSGVKDYYTIQGRFDEEKLVPLQKGEKVDPENIVEKDGKKFKKTKVFVEEQTFLLINPDLKSVMEIAGQYDQDAIIYKGKDNVVGMYSNINNNVIIATPGTEQVSTKDKPGEHDYEEAYTRARNIGLNYDFVWDDPVPLDKSNPKPVTIKTLKESGWLEKHDIAESDFSFEPDKPYREKVEDRGDKINRDDAREKFLKTKVTNPETGNEVQIDTLRKAPADSQAYRLYVQLKEEFDKYLDENS